MSPKGPTSRYLDTPYLFFGYVEYIQKSTRDKQGSRVIIKKMREVEPLCDTFLLMKRNGIWTGVITNKKGILVPYGGPKTIKRNAPRQVIRLGSTGHFFFLPPELLKRYVLAFGENWSEKVVEQFQKSNKTGVEATMWRIKPGRDLRKPKKDTKIKQYKDWYDDHKDKESLPGYIFPKVRSIFFVLSGCKDFKNASIEAWPINEASDSKKKIKIKNENMYRIDKYFYAAYADNQGRIKPGKYRIKVSFDEKKDFKDPGWHPRVVKDRFYEFVEEIRFDISNPVGEYDIVNISPITLEESILQQYPTMYKHVISAVKESAGIELDSDSKQDNHADMQSINTSLATWQEGIAWTYTKYKYALNLANMDGWEKRIKKMRDTIILAMVSEPAMPKEIADHIKGGMDFYFACKDFDKGLLNLEKFIGKSRLDKKNVDLLDAAKAFGTGKLYDNRWSKTFDAAKLKEKVAEIKIHELEQQFFRVQTRETLVSRLGKIAEVAGKITNVLEKGIMVYSLGTSRLAIGDLYNDFDNLVKEMYNTLRAYSENYNHLPNRQAINLMERYRQAACSKHQEIDQKVFEIICQGIDLVLGVMTLIPQTTLLATAVILLKSATETFIESVESVVDYLDRVAFENFNTALKENKKLESNLIDESDSNLYLLYREADKWVSDDKDRFKNAAYFMRAECINGLVHLLTRAAISEDVNSISEKNPQARLAKYIEKIKQYCIEDYIQLFVLRENWEFPGKPKIPMSMDECWLEYRDHSIKFRDRNKFMKEFGFDAPLTKVDIMDGSIFAMGVTSGGDKPLVEGNCRVSYVEQFPIHRWDSGSAEVLAKTFMPSFNWLNKECIEYTCVYKRPRNSDKEEDWKPVNPTGNSDEDNAVVDPFEQVRVLVVLDDELINQGLLVPLSLQLCRRNCRFGLDMLGTDIEGPVFRKNASILAPNVLLSCEKKAFAGKLGCIFYPRYLVGHGIFPGIKPLLTDGEMKSMQHEEKGKYKPYLLIGLGKLDEICCYFNVKAGGVKSLQKLDLGGSDNKLSGVNHFLLKFEPYKENPSRYKELRNDFRSILHPVVLKEKTSTLAYPKVFGGRSEKPIFGVSDLFLALEGPNVGSHLTNNLDLEEHHWKAKIKLLFLIFAHSDCIRREYYENLSYDWRDTPVSVTMLGDDVKQFLVTDGKSTPTSWVPYDGGGTLKGPRYGGKLLHIGHVYMNDINTVPKEIQVDNKEEHSSLGVEKSIRANSKMKNLIGYINADPTIRKKIQQSILGATKAADIAKPQGEYAMFLAEFSPYYNTKEGHSFHCLRPFGSPRIENGRKFIQISFKGIISAGNVAIPIYKNDGKTDKISIRIPYDSKCEDLFANSTKYPHYPWIDDYIGEMETWLHDKPTIINDSSS